jgi:hypothetical protein
MGQLVAALFAGAHDSSNQGATDKSGKLYRGGAFSPVWRYHKRADVSGVNLGQAGSKKPVIIWLLAALESTTLQQT